MAVEDPKDPFDRQRCVLDWKQNLLQEQVCLVLGVGGLGCAVSFGLARLGVKKIILVDRDNVELTNLNRQILFNAADVGKHKVDAAAGNLAGHCVGGTAVEALHFDAVEQWGRVVKLAKQSTVIFNNIDFGHYFDFAVLSLCRKLALPYSSGSSYSNNWIVEYYTGAPTESSFSLQSDNGQAEVYTRLDPAVIDSLDSLNFLEPDPKPPSRQFGSHAIVCVSAGLMTVNAWLQNKIMGKTMPNFSKLDLDHYWEPDGVVGWPAPVDETQPTIVTTTSLPQNDPANSLLPRKSRTWRQSGMVRAIVVAFALGLAKKVVNL